MKPTARKLLRAVGGKTLYVPPNGWNAANFARYGGAMLRTLHRTAQIVQRRAQPVLAKVARDMILLYVEKVIHRVTKSAGSKDPLASILFPQSEAIWVRALQDVAKEMNIQMTVEVMPVVQSVMAQGYSKTGMMMGLDDDPTVHLTIANKARGIASQITRINETTRNQAENIIRDSIKEGLSVSDVSKRLMEEMEDISANRMLTIARTELNNAWTQGSVASIQQSSSCTHVSVIGCQAREADSPQYNGESTCNIQDVPVYDADKLKFHINHTGTIVPSRFRDYEGSFDFGPRPAALQE